MDILSFKSAFGCFRVVVVNSSCFWLFLRVDVAFFAYDYLATLHWTDMRQEDSKPLQKLIDTISHLVCCANNQGRETYEVEKTIIASLVIGCYDFIASVFQNVLWLFPSQHLSQLFTLKTALDTQKPVGTANSVSRTYAFPLTTANRTLIYSIC